jgi:2-enoate reductase
MKLFEPGKIGKVCVKNKIVMSPMGVGGLIDPSGKFTQRAVDYYVARAKGGVGLLISGMTRVEMTLEEQRESPFTPLARVDGYLYGNGLGELADAIHDYGAKVFVQLSAGFGRVVHPLTLRNRPVAPSVLPCFRDPNLMTRALSTEEVENLVGAFGFGAKVLRDSGIDGVMLHGHEGYLFDQFTTELWNRRNDKYGGSFEKRLTFPTEVIQNIKNTVGNGFPVIYQMGLNHYVVGGRGVEESINMAKYFEDIGVDGLLVDNGCYETWYWAHPPVYQPPGCLVDAAETIKKEVKIPVIGVGKLGNPALANRILEQGKADFIALGRPLLADPEWPNKVRNGCWDDIRPCIGCHEGCLKRVILGSYISCAVNPATGNEKELAIRPTEERKSVLVVGGGPGGIEAACVAALRGHSVTLWEKVPRLGGALNAASGPAFKHDLKLYMDYLIRQINRLGVQIVLGKEATIELIKKENADVVIIATGSLPIMPNIPGVKREEVMTALDVLMRDKVPGTSVVVVGGGTVGCETGVYLAQQGRKVTIVEILDHLADGAFEANRQQLVKMVADSGVKVFTHCEVKRVTDQGVVIEDKKGKETNIKTDTIVIAMGFKPNSGLYETLKRELAEVYAIGDCIQPRLIKNAVWEAYRLARLI